MSANTQVEQRVGDDGPRPGSNRRRKVSAILAGGLALGVGAAVTLAAWNDSEFATGIFGSGQFGIEGSTDGTAFSSSPTSLGKTLAFEVDADALSPGDTVYAPAVTAKQRYTGSVTALRSNTGLRPPAVVGESGTSTVPVVDASHPNVDGSMSR